MKIVCVGLNYVDHAREVEMELPERPLLFAKWSNIPSRGILRVGGMCLAALRWWYSSCNS